LFRVLTPEHNPSLIEPRDVDEGWPGLDGAPTSSIIPGAFHHPSNSYGFEIFRPEAYVERYPDICNLVTHEGILEAGDVLYIPNSSPHGAVNLEATIAITANYASPWDDVQMQYYADVCEAMPERDLCGKLSSEKPSLSSFREMDYFEYAGYTFEKWCQDRLYRTFHFLLLTTITQKSFSTHVRSCVHKNTVSMLVYIHVFAAFRRQ